MLAARLLSWLRSVSRGSYRDFFGKIVRRKEQVETRMELKLSGPPVGLPERGACRYLLHVLAEPLRAVVVV